MRFYTLSVYSAGILGWVWKIFQFNLKLCENLAERTKYDGDRRRSAPESAQVGQCPLDDITHRLRVDRQQPRDFLGHQVLEKTEVNDFLLAGRELVDRRSDLLFQSQVILPPNPIFLARKFGQQIVAFVGQPCFVGEWFDRFQHPVSECLDKVKFDRWSLINGGAVEPEMYQQILDHIFDQLHIVREPLAILEERPVMSPGKLRVCVLVPTTERIP